MWPAGASGSDEKQGLNRLNSLNGLSQAARLGRRGRRIWLSKTGGETRKAHYAPASSCGGKIASRICNVVGKAGVCSLKQAIDSGIASSADGPGEPWFITKDTKEEGTKDSKGLEGLRLP